MLYSVFFVVSGVRTPDHAYLCIVLSYALSFPTELSSRGRMLYSVGVLVKQSKQISFNFIKKSVIII
jgi:hypothetical protein